MQMRTRQDYQMVVQRTLERVLTSLDEVPSLTILAGEVGFSAFHFHRIFQGMLGETLGEFTKRVQLERAAYRLSQNLGAISEIAIDAGYSHEGFCRAFRVAYGCSPTEYRAGRGAYRLPCNCGLHFDPEGVIPLFVPRDTGGKLMNVEIVDQPELRTACLRHIGPYNEIGPVFQKLAAIAGPNGMFAYPQLQSIGIFYDDNSVVPAAELRSDACLTVSADAVIPEGLAEGKIPAGKYAKYTHTGSYAHLGDSWSRMMGEWLPNSGYSFGEGNTFEVYVNNCNDVPEDQLLTDLYVPIA